MLPWGVDPVTMLGFAVRATIVPGAGLALAWLIRNPVPGSSPVFRVRTVPN